MVTAGEQPTRCRCVEVAGVESSPPLLAVPSLYAGELLRARVSGRRAGMRASLLRRAEMPRA